MEKKLTKKDQKQALLSARQEGLKTWSGIEHRLEWVGTWNDVDFVNDSKATDVESVYYSLDTLNKPITWICSNDEDNEKFNALNKLVKYKVWSVVGFGPNLYWDPSFQSLVDSYENHTSWEVAWMRAAAMARPGTVVLLSPGSASFDLFKNFKERGDTFKQWVTDWANKQ